MYKIIIYKVIIYYIPQKNRKVKKVYYQKIKTIHDINIKELSKIDIEIYQKYRDIKITTAIVKENENDWFTENLNKKSEKAYQDYIKNGGLVRDTISATIDPWGDYLKRKARL